MTNISVLEDIIQELENIQRVADETYIKAAVAAHLVKYKKMLKEEKCRNALDVIEYKIAHLTRKLTI